jgi:hypothetical protein
MSIRREHRAIVREAAKAAPAAVRLSAARCGLLGLLLLTSP